MNSAKNFSLSKTQINHALKKLVFLGLLNEKEQGNFEVIENYEVPSMDSISIKNHHSQILKKAEKAIFSQAPMDRELRGLTLSFDKSCLKDASSQIEKFVGDFNKKFSKGKRNSVYQLSICFFRLDEKGE